MTTIKLIKVTNRTYRSENNNVMVWSEKGEKNARITGLAWVVRYSDGLGCRVEKRFRTLDECREYLNQV